MVQENNSLAENTTAQMTVVMLGTHQSLADHIVSTLPDGQNIWCGV